MSEFFFGLTTLRVYIDDLLHVTKGTWTESLNVLREFPVPRIHKLMFKQEIDQLEALNVIKKVNRPQWGGPTFLIPKKDRTVCFISDFRELIKRILRQPYLIPKIQDLLLRLRGFR